MQEILLNVEPKQTRLAYLKGGVLQDLVYERKSSRQITGNIYRGKVTSILHNIQSAFININEQENGFIHISDILENSQKFQEMYDMEMELANPKKKQEDDITKILKIDQPVLVQVVKESIGSKGARLTSNVSIAGRYLVLLPNTPHRGVSRKIEDSQARDRLKKLLKSLDLPAEMGFICRTASSTATAEELTQEAHELYQTFLQILEKFQKTTKPQCLYEEMDLIKRAVLKAVDKKYERILIDDYAVHKTAKTILNKYAPTSTLKLEFYRDKTPIFERFGVEKEIDRALKRKIWLPSGGYLFFDKTEAMHTIDVNSGRSSKEGSKDLEEALVQINLEAADEISRQIKIRNVGGLIVCDFIDMRSRKSQRRVLDRLKEAMKEDSAKCTILGMSEFGLVEMTRQRYRESLAQTIQASCPYCTGLGSIKSFESLSIEIERTLKFLITHKEHFALELLTHPEMDHYLNHNDKDLYRKIAEKNNADLKFSRSDALHLNDFHFYSTTNGKRIEL
jgi:ribonuclease G